MLLIGMLTGHCPFKKHLMTIGVVSVLYQTCGLEGETAFHFVCNCPVFGRIRSRTHGRYYIIYMYLRSGVSIRDFSFIGVRYNGQIRM